MTERPARRIVPILTTLGVLSALITGVATNLVADWVSLRWPAVLAILLVSTLIAVFVAVRLQQPDAAPDRPGTEPPVRMKGYRRNPFFVGRDAELTKLHAFAGPVVVTGMGGIGKTQLVVEFADRYRNEFAGGVFWLDFEDERSALAEIAACGAVDGFRLYLKDDKLTLEERAALVRREWEKPVRRLLIFDNCEDPELLQRHQPAGGGCRIIVTSRDGYWDEWLGVTTFPLDVLDRGQSVALICSFWEDLKPGDPVLGEICAELGDLPLALHMAGRFLQEHRGLLPPADYLADLRAAEPIDHPSLDDDRLPTPTRHVSALGRTFRLSHGRLDPDDPVDATARTMLVHAALFAPGQPIPASLLTACSAPAGAEPAMVNRARRAAARLVALGLLDRPGNAADVFRIHRLTASFARRTADDLPSARRDAEQAIVEVIRQPNRSGHPRRVLGLHTHLQWLVGPGMAREDALGAALYHEYGRGLHVLGDVVGARRYLLRALEIRDAVLDEHSPEIAETLLHLGTPAYFTSGHDEPKAFLERALTIREHLPGGATDTETAWVLNFLGNISAHAYDDDSALEYHQRALAIWTAAADPGRQEESLHEIAVGHLNVGIDLAWCGQPIECVEHLETSCGIFLHPDLDIDHLDTQFAHLRLAQARADWFEYDEADRILDEVLGRVASNGETGNFSAIEVIGGAGLVKMRMWRLDEAERLLRTGADLSRNTYSAAHAQTIRWTCYLGDVLVMRGSPDEGLNLYQDNATAPSTLRAIIEWRMSRMLRYCERFAETISTLDHAVEIARVKPGPDHPFTHQLAREQVIALTLQGSKASLAEAHRRLAAVSQPTLYKTEKVRGAVFHANRDFPAAAAALGRALDDLRGRHPERYGDIADLLVELAEAERLGRRLVDAGQHLAEARDLLLGRVGEAGHPLLLPVRQASVDLAVARGDLAEAEELADGIARWYAERLPDNHPDLLLHRYRLGVVRARRGNARAARAAAVEYVRHVRQHFGGRHSLLVEPLATLGGIYRDLGHFPAAEETLREGIELAAARWPDGHEVRVRLVVELAKVWIRNGRAADVPGLVEDGFRLAGMVPGPSEELTTPLFAVRGGAEDLERAVEQGSLIWADGHPELALIRGRLGIVRREIGSLDLALEVLERQAPRASSTRELRAARRRRSR